MSRLSDLMRQARKIDPQLASDLESEISALQQRRTYGLVFEQHQPEAVELPGRQIRRGDKVRVLPQRGTLGVGDQRLWRVERIERGDGGRIAHLTEERPRWADEESEPEQQSARAEDLVVVAEFRDTIYPGLVETGRVERGGDKPFHTVINAENFHALELLTYTHRHSIDAIYIDPPYNTGAKDWKYNNNYVESDDDYRHSKWLAFMERRLKIARELLNPDDSVLIVTIDEKEYLRLGLLLEQTFPGVDIQMITSVIAPGGQPRKNQMSRVEEYVFVLYFGSASVGQDYPPATATERDAEVTVSAAVAWENLIRRGTSARREDRENQFYPFFIDPHTGRIVDVGQPLLPASAARASVSAPPGTEAVWPIRSDGSEGRWRISSAASRKLLDKGYLRVGRTNKSSGQRAMNYVLRSDIARIEAGEIVATGRANDGSALLERRSATTTIGGTPKTVWSRESHNAGNYGTALVRKFLPSRAFPFPKSLYAVEDALRFFVAVKPEATVLDFFAGSGTTAHAVMRLNKQDGGRRQCISVTNNEVSADEQKGLRQKGLRAGDPEWEALGICDYITKPRITAAITGKTPQGEPIMGDYKFTDEFPMADGFEQNAAFLTLTYEAPLSVRQNRAFARIAPMLWLRAGSQGRIIADLDDRGWDVAETYGVLANLDDSEEFARAIRGAESVRLAFIVTDDESAFQMVCRELPSSVVTVRLYESYLTNFEINTGRSL